MGYRVAISKVGMVSLVRIVSVGVWIMFPLRLARKDPCCIGLKDGFFFMEGWAFINGMCEQGAKDIGFNNSILVFVCNWLFD